MDLDVGLIYKEGFELLADSSAWGYEDNTSAKELCAYIDGVNDMTKAVLKLINRSSKGKDNKEDK